MLKPYLLTSHFCEKSKGRRGFLNHFLAAVLGLAVTAVPGLAVADNFPNRPVRLVVGFPPGGGVDVAARLVGAELGKRLGQPVVVDNISGAGGNIGTDRVAKAPADGYTLLFGSIALAINPSLYPKLSFDPLKDLAPVSLISTSPYVLMVNAQSPIRDLRDMVKVAQESPGKLRFASAGNGSGSHLFMELFLSTAGVRMDHVPYRGAAPAMTDVVAGHVPIVFDSIMTSLPYAESGKVRILGVSSKARSKISPEIPTLQEAGVPGYDATSWFGIFAPSGTPAAALKKLNQELVATIRTPEVAEKLRKLGAEPVGSSSEELGRFYQTEVERWRKVVKSVGVELN
ncbi:Bug family tripartite tricarboxylate transporter substrate binding protein [Ottowia thiooxydans]|uniref:Bug family tripartite tricarboxylate transporter substrate binding protein n=1 Tax=Ottowia thiooxydans TaxID=219182 RepID=UPI0003FC10FE|nr:tripartite tricarboxylate transporter substrate binding protein [Ottowia thiooxydans]